MKQEESQYHQRVFMIWTVFIYKANKKLLITAGSFVR